MMLTLSRTIPPTLALALSISLGLPSLPTFAASTRARTPTSIQVSTIYACVSSNGAARISARPLKCKRGDTQVAWRAVAGGGGAQGLAGNPGPAGAPGAAGARGETGLRGEAGSKGEPGLAGVKGETGASGAEGKEGIAWKGTWSASTAYKLKEAVFYEGSSYISIRESPENKGKTPSTEPSYWELMAKEGKQGVKGEPGEKGPAGGFPVGKYEASKEVKSGEELEASKTEPVQVTLIVSGEKEKEATSKVTVEGKIIAETLGGNALSTTRATVTFIVPTGQKWKVTATAVAKLEYTYLTV